MTSGYERKSLETLAEDVYAFPLSFAQQRLWFLNQLEPDSPVYNQFKALKLRGRLNREALQKTLDTIVERHEVLRTTFLTVDDKPAQVIHEPGPVELTAIDLTGIPIEQREEALPRFLSDFTRRPFDLQKDWPLRAALIRLTGKEHILLVVMHHIASDGWSNDILFRELSALYEAFCQGKSSPLEDLPIQYADYAVLQKEWLQGEVLQQQLSYWKKQLEDISPLRVADGPFTSGGAGASWPNQNLYISASLCRNLKSPEPPRRRYSIHDLAGGVSNTFASLYGSR